MKKLIIFIVVLTLLLSACSTAEVKISPDRAKEIALSHAGVKEEDATFLRTEKERENGKFVYEVGFYSKDKKEYDYEIDADTGKIIKFESESAFD